MSTLRKVAEFTEESFVENPVWTWAEEDDESLVQPLLLGATAPLVTALDHFGLCFALELPLVLAMMADRVRPEHLEQGNYLCCVMEQRRPETQFAQHNLF
jgi:hypothetical protein